MFADFDPIEVVPDPGPGSPGILVTGRKGAGESADLSAVHPQVVVPTR